MTDESAVWVADGPRIEGASEGPLRGQRLAVKDLFEIEGFVTGAGNPDWRASHAAATRTASAVRKLLDAGAEMVGKTQTDELAYSLNGANVHYGTPVNPAAPDRLPGGSSSGSAVAVAAGEADIGLGTDTGGSIRVPSSYCGLYGLRPSWGAIASDGLVALAPRFDTVGFMCRQAALLARVGDVLLPSQPLRKFSSVRVLVPQGVDFGPAQVSAQFERLGLALDARQLDADTMGRASEAFRVLQGREIWRTHGEWISRVQPRFADDIQARIEWCAGLDAGAENEAQRAAVRIVGLLREWSEDGECALCLPSAPGASPLLELAGVELARYRERLMGMTALGGLWGAAVLALPWLEDQGAPWGVSLIAAPGEDRSLLALLKR
ncbi:amidase [Halotalea alkalilenta]|uniref:amidase n=1 Tax=Halotalea alkalilenta TaxID=376489 RepID=UPI00048A3F52|nr:amidase [Halotalea alkalilenta]